MSQTEIMSQTDIMSQTENGTSSDGPTLGEGERLDDELTRLLRETANPTIWTLQIDEGQRQIVLLGLHKLREERPGWDFALGEIEIRLGGRLDWPPSPARQPPPSSPVAASKPVSPSAMAKRAASFWLVAQQIADGLRGAPFRWGEGERRHYVAKAAALGVTLVTVSGAKKMGRALRKGAKPVGTAYFGAPIRRHADLYVLECQCAPVAPKVAKR